MTTVTLPSRIIRLPQVCSRTGLSRSTIYEHISRGRFPKQISLVRISANVTADFGPS